LDLSRFGDEELVVLAQECGFQPAAHALTVRLGPWVNNLIARRARPCRLRDADLEDARQEAWFWMTEAIGRYNTRELGRPNGCSFRTFLYCLIGSRVVDFGRRMWRQQCRFRPAIDLAHAAAVGRLGQVSSADRGGNPLATLIGQEARACLELALDSLDAQGRALWQGLINGLSLHAIARQLGISYQQARGRRQQLLAKLKARLVVRRRADR
jgi:RNA polymerase sigma factor (sigma-70 family)